LEVQQILSQFSYVSNEPSSLPPTHPRDHPDSKPINMRPYKFSYSQKLKIENILEDLLNNKFIQPSSSSFTSSVLLVKKSMVHDACVLIIEK
jgi:hypothetical protein